MRRPFFILAALASAVVLNGCEPKGPTFPGDALDRAIGGSIGDPTTCVILADRLTGKQVYRYGQDFNCVRGLPACDRRGFLSATGALALAQAPEGRYASCPTSPDGSRTVGWAAGKVEGDKRDLVYSAVMEGDRALPGQEMKARLDAAFRKAGL
jgi:hypothetical protein